MKYSKWLIVAFLILGLSQFPLLAAKKFDYKMAQSDEVAPEGTFYRPASSDATLKNISGNQVRNIILCIGDGMGFNHVALARHNSVGPGKKLHMERWPVAGMMRTYSADDLVTDSAAAGTALPMTVEQQSQGIGK